MSNYNKCEGCKLWNGHHCTGARSYEPNADEHKAICNEHMAEQFWVVSKQLYNAEARVKELKEENQELRNSLSGSLMFRFTSQDKEVARYRKALEEIEEIAKSFNINGLCFYDDINDCSNCDMNTDCNYLRKYKILDIINKVIKQGA